jgi:hypothetical protein
MYWERNFAVSLDSGYTTSALRARSTKLTQKFGGPEGGFPIFFRFATADVVFCCFR